MTHSLDRRSLLTAGALAASGLALTLGQRPATAQDATPTPPPVPDGPFSLPELPFAYDALEPHIDTLTMQIHHDRHHAAYVNNLNSALANYPDLHDRTLAELLTGLADLPEEIRTAVRNNGGGHFNHTLFWELMAPGGGAPTGDLLTAIERDLGGPDAAQQAVNDAGLRRFGSGWSWIVSNGGALSVASSPNQDNPLIEGTGVPILGIDVWEHAYYLLYQNRRGDYLTAWWNVVNWDAVAANYAASMA